MPGFRLSKADKESIAEKYFCIYCVFLLRDAMQTSCGHFYCQSCLINLIQDAASMTIICLKDQKRLQPNEVFADKFMRREILALVVHCTFMDDGCIWKGEVRHLENHTATCEFLKIPCVHPECGVLVKKADLTEHLEKECMYRLEQCRYCQRQINLNRMKEHLRTNHNHLLREVDNLRDAVDDILHGLENLEVVPRDLHVMLEKLVQRVEFIEHTLALRNVTPADLPENVRQQEFTSYDGQLVWKITDYARRRNDAVAGQQLSLYSPCFYTSCYGYKMCARLYLNGDGKGRGTHISVFFVVMRGQYDALLHWPFRQKVTFMLLDQDNVKHVIEAFRPDPNSSSFQRPRRETNIASGCPMFCSLDELNNHAYIQDDTMFIKVIVDTIDL